MLAVGVDRWKMLQVCEIQNIFLNNREEIRIFGDGSHSNALKRVNGERDRQTCLRFFRISFPSYRLRSSHWGLGT